MLRETREKTYGHIQQELVSLQDALASEPEPLDGNARRNREITTLRELLRLTSDLLPADIAIEVRALLSLLDQGVPTGE
jgi:hypothetical protein